MRCKFVAIGIQKLYRNGGPGGGRCFYGESKLIGCATCESLFGIWEMSEYLEPTFEAKAIAATSKAEFPTVSRNPSYDHDQWKRCWTMECQYRESQESKGEGGTTGH
jgi:hypothetical protein